MFTGWGQKVVFFCVSHSLWVWGCFLLIQPYAFLRPYRNQDSRAHNWRRTWYKLAKGNLIPVACILQLESSFPLWFHLQTAWQPPAVATFAAFRPSGFAGVHWKNSPAPLPVWTASRSTDFLCGENAKPLGWLIPLRILFGQAHELALSAGIQTPSAAAESLIPFILMARSGAI